MSKRQEKLHNQSKLQPENINNIKVKNEILTDRNIKL